MRLYAFRCRICHKELTMNSPERTHYCCGAKMARDYRSTYVSPSPFVPHFNHSVNSWVTSDQDFRDKLKVASDLQSERLGLTHNYQPIHPADLRAMDKSDGLTERLTPQATVITD